MTVTEAARPRWATKRTPERATWGTAAAKIARLLGTPFLPWQRYVADVALEVDSTGRLVYKDATVSVMRQQGKTVLYLCLVLTRAFLEPGSHTIYAAQSGLDGLKKWDREWVPAIENSLFADQVTATRAPGRQALNFANGSIQTIAASTLKASHGAVIDQALLDEAFSYADSRIEQALKPAMMTRRNSQFWVASAAGTPEKSPYLLDRVQTGRAAVEAGLTDTIAHFEYGAPDDADPADPATWRASMPALGHTVTEDAVRSAQVSMKRNDFARAYLNRWVASMGEPLIDSDHWASLAEPDSPRPPWVVLGVDVSPHSASAAIVAVGEHDGDLQGAVLEAGQGVEWLPGALERVCADYGEPYVVLDRKACAAMLPSLSARPAFASKNWTPRTCRPPALSG